MKLLRSSHEVKIPEKVTVFIKSRHVTVKGPRGTLSRKFKYQDVDISLQNKGKTIKVEMWFGQRKQLAAIRTIASHIQNMITGVTKGFRYRMRFVYAHFPVNVNIKDDKRGIEIRNFLGEKVTRKVDMLDGVSVFRNEKAKDEIILEGNNLELVSQSAASIQQSTLVKGKDIRKFLDGIYVSEKGTIED